MAPKRKRNGSVSSKKPLNGSLSSRWGWVSSEVVDVDKITLEHRMAASNLSVRNRNPFCPNKYGVDSNEVSIPEPAASNATHVNGELSEDVIVVSDTDEPVCSKKACKTNPWCLNYLNQEIWENEGKSSQRHAGAFLRSSTDDGWESFVRAAKLGEDPSFLSREPGLPVGLKVCIK